MSTAEPDTYLNIQGTQFGFMEQVCLEKRTTPGQYETLHKIEGWVWTWPVWRLRVWCLLNGYGWVRKG